MIHVTPVLINTCQYLTSTSVHGTFLLNPFHMHDLHVLASANDPSIQLFGLLHLWQHFFCSNFLSTAYKCNYVGHWQSVKVLHKEGKGGQVSIQPFTAEGNSLCHIHLNLHTYQARRNLKLTNISIDFVQVMEQISILS